MITRDIAAARIEAAIERLKDELPKDEMAHALAMEAERRACHVVVKKRGDIARLSAVMATADEFNIFEDEPS